MATTLGQAWTQGTLEQGAIPMTLTSAQRPHRVSDVCPGEPRPIAAYCQARQLSNGQPGIAHLRTDGTVAFYPHWTPSGFNYVCHPADLVYGPYTDDNGYVLPA